MNGLVHYLTISLGLNINIMKLDIYGTAAKCQMELLDCLSLLLLSSFSFVVMLKDDSELEYPQCEIRAPQHWYPIPHHFL